MKTSPSNIRIAYQNSTANKASINETVEAVKNKGSTTQQPIGKVSHTDKQDFFFFIITLFHRNSHIQVGAKLPFRSTIHNDYSKFSTVRNTVEMTSLAKLPLQNQFLKT